MTIDYDKLSIEEKVYGFIEEYLDGVTIDEKSKAVFQHAVTDEKLKELEESYPRAHGMFQITMSSIQFTEDERQALRDMVEDEKTRLIHEAANIEEISRSAMVSDIARRAVILVAVCAVIFGVVYYFTPKAAPKFDPLQSLAYEAEAFDEGLEKEFDFPSTQIDELYEYFSRHPEIDFPVAIVRAQSQGFLPEGATVIDYGTANIAMIRHLNKDKNLHLYQFTYKGRLKDLPRSEPGNHLGLVYQAYESNSFNIIAWENSEGAVNLLVGRQSGPDLAAIAHTSRIP